MPSFSPSKPLVSVIIPAYNAEKYLAEAIDSVLAQTYQPIEIIVVDNGSTDGTQTIARSYGDRIIYLNYPGNTLASGRNIGMKTARGDLIAFLDSDDIFLPKKIERQAVYLAEHPECGVSYAGIAHFYDGEPKRTFVLGYEYYSGDDVFPNLLKKNFINPLSVIMRRSAVDRAGFFDASYRRSEDWEYWIRLAHAGIVFMYLPETLAKYRMRRDSMSYGWSAELERKKTVVQIFETLSSAMSPDERAKYHMSTILLRHRAKLWYAKVANYFIPLKWLQQWMQKRRLQ